MLKSAILRGASGGGSVPTEWEQDNDSLARWGLNTQGSMNFTHTYLTLWTGLGFNTPAVQCAGNGGTVFAWAKGWVNDVDDIEIVVGETYTYTGKLDNRAWLNDLSSTSATKNSTLRVRAYENVNGGGAFTDMFEINWAGLGTINIDEDFIIPADRAGSIQIEFFASQDTTNAHSLCSHWDAKIVKVPT